MIASSMSKPTERVSASIVMLFEGKSEARIRAKGRNNRDGRATALISVVRIFPKKRNTARTAKKLPMIRCFCTSLMDRMMNVDWSMAMFSVIPGGSVMLIFSISALTRFATSTGIGSPDCF